MYQPRRILFDPMMTMSMRIIHEHEKVQKANQRTSITWSKAKINQITSTSKWTQDFCGHLEMIPIQEFYEFYDAKLHNLWRYKFTNVFNLSKATPCSLGHPQGGQVSSSKGCIDHLEHQNAHRIWCLPRENEPLACILNEWSQLWSAMTTSALYKLQTARIGAFLGDATCKALTTIDWVWGFKTTYLLCRELPKCNVNPTSKWTTRQWHLMRYNG